MQVLEQAMTDNRMAGTTALQLDQITTGTPAQEEGAHRFRMLQMSLLQVVRSLASRVVVAAAVVAALVAPMKVLEEALTDARMSELTALQLD